MKTIASFLADNFEQIGWVVGLVSAVVLQTLAAPLEPRLPFALAGVVSHISGFVVGLKRSEDGLTGPFSGIKLLLGCTGAFLISSAVYFFIVSRIDTPNISDESVQFIFFVIANFSLGAVLAFSYRTGADFIIEKLG